MELHLLEVGIKVNVVTHCRLAWFFFSRSLVSCLHLSLAVCMEASLLPDHHHPHLPAVVLDQGFAALLVSACSGDEGILLHDCCAGSSCVGRAGVNEGDEQGAAALLSALQELRVLACVTAQTDTLVPQSCPIRLGGLDSSLLSVPISLSDKSRPYIDC